MATIILSRDGIHEIMSLLNGRRREFISMASGIICADSVLPSVKLLSITSLEKCWHHRLDGEIITLISLLVAAPTIARASYDNHRSMMNDRHAAASRGH